MSIRNNFKGTLSNIISKQFETLKDNALFEKTSNSESISKNIKNINESFSEYIKKAELDPEKSKEYYNQAINKVKNSWNGIVSDSVIKTYEKEKKQKESLLDDSSIEKVKNIVEDVVSDKSSETSSRTWKNFPSVNPLSSVKDTWSKQWISDDIKTKASEYSSNIIKHGGRISRDVAVGVSHEFISKNPIIHLASQAILGGAKKVIPDNTIGKNIINFSHEAIHGEPIEIKNVIKNSQKKEKSSRLLQKIPFGFVFGLILPIVVRFILKRKKK